MAEAVEVREKLDKLAIELDERSNDLAKVSRELDPLNGEYENFIEVAEVGMWDAHEKEEKKLPAKDMRLLLALREMPLQIRGRHRELVDARERLKRRISDLKVEVDCQRSILSALKAELECSS